MSGLKDVVTAVGNVGDYKISGWGMGNEIYLLLSKQITKFVPIMENKKKKKTEEEEKKAREFAKKFAKKYKTVLSKLAHE